MRRIAFLIPLLLFAGLAVFFVLGFNHDPREIPSVMIDKPVPAFDLQPLAGSGKPGFKSSDLTGQVHYVNVFASWCVPCRIEHPVVTDLATRHGVPVMAINQKDKPADALAWLEKHGNPFTAIGVDANGRTSIDFGVYGVPESFLIDAQGRIRFKQIGPLTPDVLENKLLPLIRELRKG